MVSTHMKLIYPHHFLLQGNLSIKCKTNFNNWIKLKYFYYQKIVKCHHWKILIVGIGFLGLCWFGFKSMEFEKDLMNLWIYNSSRLHNETTYMSHISGTQIDPGSFETIIQVSVDNLLSPQYLLEHLQLLKMITNLTLQYDGRTFSFREFCQRIEFPNIQYVDKDLRSRIVKIMPCRIITPLNCFWEGSKLVEHDSRSSISRNEDYPSINWSSLNFSDFLIAFKNDWYYNFFVTLFKEAGISNGYMNKPCIDVTDQLCPNKKIKNIGFEEIVNQGCYQLAKNLYRYSKNTFLGKENKGLQSILLLKSSSDILQSLTNKDLQWTEKTVQTIKNLWLKELSKTVIKFNKQRPYLKSIAYRDPKFQSQRTKKSSFYVFTNNSLNVALNQAKDDETLPVKYFISLGVVMLFLVVIFVSTDNCVRSHCWLAIISTLLLEAAIFSGLGLTAAAGFTFSALTTQIVPFLMIGLGLDEVVIFTNKYTRTMDSYQSKKSHPNPVAQTLYDCAKMLLVSFLTKITIMSSTLLIPIPLMHSFSIQVLFIIVVQTAVNVFLYPCLLHLDSIRRQDNRIDLLCCLVKRQLQTENIKKSSESQGFPLKYDKAPKESNLMNCKVIFSTEFTTSSVNLIPDNVHQYCEINPIDTPKSDMNTLPKSFSNSLHKTKVSERKTNKPNKHQCWWRFQYRITKTFLHIIVLVPVQITMILITILIIVMGFYSAINIDCGILLDSIFIRDSNEYNFVKYESKYFRFQMFEIITKKINYTYHQDSVLQLHNEIKGLPRVEMLENGNFWLSSFISWLQNIQKDFDEDMKAHLIFPNGTFLRNASKNGLLTMTLLAQDGENISYKKLGTSRLLNAQRIDEDNFFLFLNVWRSVSAESGTLPCILYPRLPVFNMENFLPNERKPEPSVIRVSGSNLFTQNPLQFVACKYLYKGQSDRDDFDFVKAVRSITGRFTKKGVLSIPTGNIFSLSEQYTKLRYQLMMATIIICIGMFIISLLAINHFLASIFATLLLSSSLLSPILFMNIYQIPLNATSGVMSLWSGGLGFRFSLFLIASYVDQYQSQPTHKSLNLFSLNCNRCSDRCPSNIKLVTESEKQSQLERAFEDVQCGKAMFSTFLGMAFILLTNIDFLWQHFFLLPFIGLTHSMLNYYCLAPILCFNFIRKSESKSCQSPVDRPQSSKCTPKISHQSSINSTKSQRSHNFRNITKFSNNYEGPSHGKLSIIPEESSSILSSTKSSISHENQNVTNDSSSDLSQSQEDLPCFMKQTIESSAVIHYTTDESNTSQKDNAIILPNLEIKTYFKFHQPLE